jgi:hypothetical protein
MTHPLEAIDWRLERASQHLATLKRRQDSFQARIDKKDRRFIGQLDSDASEYVFPLNGKPPDPRIGLIVGEFGHHLRAALDNLVWQLVFLRGGSPTTQNQFPIYESWEGYRDSRSRLLRGISADDRAAIERCQPFQHGESAPDSYLALLAWLNNVDKHRFVHVGGPLASRFPIRVSFGPKSPDVGDFPWYAVPVRDVRQVGRPTYVSAMANDDRTELMRIPVKVTGPHPKMKMKGDEPVEISLSDPKHSLLLRDLTIMHRIVESIIEGFRPRFDI